MAADSPTPQTPPEDVSLSDDRLATAPPSVGERSVREVVLSAEVRALRLELERRERRSKLMVDRYETLLEAQAAAARDDETFVWSRLEDWGASPRSSSSLRDRLTALFSSSRRLARAVPGGRW